MENDNTSFNLFWTVYKNLEKEVIELTYSIQFTDDQLEYIKKDGKRPEATEDLLSLSDYVKTPVYSLKTVDLLIRCCTEIEALLMELTRHKDEEVRKTSTVDPSKSLDVGCRLKYLKHIWNMEKKAVVVTCSNMYFKKAENKEFTPFDYIKESLDDFYKAYNSVKHDRTINIYKGNIRFLLHAMGALFLLNLYYKDETYKIGSFEQMKDDIIFLGKKKEISYDSDLFAAKSFFIGWREVEYYSDEFLAATYIIAPDLRQYALCMSFLNQYGEIVDLTEETLINEKPPEQEPKYECTHRLTMADDSGMARWVKCEQWVLDKHGQYALRASINKNQKFEYLHYSSLDPKSWVAELGKIAFPK